MNSDTTNVLIAADELLNNKLFDNENTKVREIINIQTTSTLSIVTIKV